MAAQSDAAPRPTYWLTRFVFLRLLGFLYGIAFLVLAEQGPGLIGRHGLTPADRLVASLIEEQGSRAAAFAAEPSVFLWLSGDEWLSRGAWLGVALGALVMLGCANALLMFVLWALYLSFVHVGQVWYGFGWEILLLETGFLAIFLCPLLDPRPFPRRAPPAPVVWLLRWLCFRVMFGAGLIKLRGDSCWTDLTCLFYHYETQPLPNPLSRTLHFLPAWFHVAGVLFNHLVEVIVPFFLFWPRLARHIAGALVVMFQLILIASGNLSFLNWLTIAVTIACFDDSLLARLLPGALSRRARAAAERARASLGRQIAAWVLVAAVVLLSIGPITNMLSGSQRMNASFDRLHLVNTYGAFGSVGRERREIVLEGTTDAVLTDATEWREYEFKGKPGDPRRRPPIVSPYHYRLDWQMWFAAMTVPRREPWAVHLIWKLLHGDRAALDLLANDPFPGTPPRFVRARLYHYRFARPGSDLIWERELIGDWLQPMNADDPRLIGFLTQHGWLPE